MALEAVKAYIYQGRSLEVRESLFGFKIEINIFYLTNFKILLSCSFYITILFKQFKSYKTIIMVAFTSIKFSSLITFKIKTIKNKTLSKIFKTDQTSLKIKYFQRL